MLYLIAISVALTTGLVVVLLGGALPSRSRAMKTRMAELGLDGTTALGGSRRRAWNRTRLLDLLHLMGTRFTTSEKSQSALRARLSHAGYRDPMAIPLYLGIRITGSVSLFAVGTLIGAALEFSGVAALMIGAWGWGIGFFIPSFALSRQIAIRQKDITRALPDMLDLLVICVEAGLGLNQALIRVAAEMRHISVVMTDEIVQMNLQIRAGTPRDQALIAMAERTGVTDIRSLVTMLIQTERFGTSIARSLRIHADTMRTKRRQRAEEEAAKTAIKMIFPLAICIFPALFVVILGPAFIDIIQTLSGL